MNIKSCLLFSFALMSHFLTFGQWNPHAGIANPITIGATTDASTRDSIAHLILDGDTNTSWESDFAFPFPYLLQPERNILLHAPDSLFCSSSPKDSTFIDSIITVTVLVDSFFLDSIVVDSITMDTSFVDSLFLGMTTVDSFYLDSILVDSFIWVTTMEDSTFLDTVVVDSIGFTTIQVDSFFYNLATMMDDSIQVDSIVMDTFMVDSIFLDSVVIDVITTDTLMVDSFFIDFVQIDSTFLDSILVVDFIAVDTFMVDSFFIDAIPIDSSFIDTIAYNISNIDNNDYSLVTDGNASVGSTLLPVSDGWSWIGMEYDTLTDILAVSTKLFSQTDVSIYVYTSPMDSVLMGIYENGVDDYQLRTYEIDLTAATQVKLWSTSMINMFELGALSEYPKESVVVDLGSSQAVDQIVTRYWAGDSRAATTTLFISEDSIDWFELVQLDPNNMDVLTISVDFDTTARYIKLEHGLAILDYGRVYVWEIGLYDENGRYAGYPAAQQSSIPLGELLGMNTLWGWGHNIYSDIIPEGEGPAQFDTISTYARNYHFMDWDIADPDDVPDYSNMATSGTRPQFHWLDWDKEYQAWIDGGVDPHACIMFAHAFQPSDWDSLNFSSAYNYGYEFAKHFGPTQGNGIIEKMEIGNEPWYFDSTQYRQIMSNMAAGIKDADAQIEVFPCALQAHDSISEKSLIGLKHYIGTRITPADTMNLDGINLHAYCWDINAAGERVSVEPESASSEFRAINSMIKWRDENMPGKKLIVSEWGYDIDSFNEACTHSECVSERAGAVYTTRAALIMHRLGVDEATIFWFANSVDASTVFNRSGVLESVNNNFNKKNVFVALTTLVDSLGGSYFQEVIQEDDDAYMYLYADSLGQPSHLIAWRPNDGDDTAEYAASWHSPDYVPLHATRILGEQDGGIPWTAPTYINDTMQFTINSAPTIIRLAANPCVDHLAISTLTDISTYAADSTLVSDAVIPTGTLETIRYQAGESITLEPGFCNDGTTNFTATIEECVIDSLLPLMQKQLGNE